MDVPVESRSTCKVGPISAWKEAYQKYIEEELPNIESTQEKPQITKQQIQMQKSREKKQKQKELFERQLREWHDPELLKKTEQEFMKDPYKTVFIARLDYTLSELDISKNFSQFGIINSIRIIRDKSGKSRGYGFIEFEREADAKNCVTKLAPTGLKILGPDNKPMRVILVDIERSRLVRNWTPRRLGGGLGGRDYTKPDPRSSTNASAAASGRRLFLLSNPFSGSSNSDNYSAPKPHRPVQSAPRTYDHPRVEKPIRDKYAIYNTASNESATALSYKPKSSSERGRSIRSIRHRE